ncbi:hypothetical protein LFADAHJC_LOCUS4871 [Methylorubrum extorquens]
MRIDEGSSYCPHTRTHAYGGFTAKAHQPSSSDRRGEVGVSRPRAQNDASSTLHHRQASRPLMAELHPSKTGSDIVFQEQAVAPQCSYLLFRARSFNDIDAFIVGIGIFVSPHINEANQFSSRVHIHRSEICHKGIFAFISIFAFLFLRGGLRRGRRQVAVFTRQVFEKAEQILDLLTLQVFQHELTPFSSTSKGALQSQSTNRSRVATREECRVMRRVEATSPVTSFTPARACGQCGEPATTRDSLVVRRWPAGGRQTNRHAAARTSALPFQP